MTLGLPPDRRVEVLWVRPVSHSHQHPIHPDHLELASLSRDVPLVVFGKWPSRNVILMSRTRERKSRLVCTLERDCERGARRMVAFEMWVGLGTREIQYALSWSYLMALGAVRDPGRHSCRRGASLG